jgi:hypothetical protein
MIVKAKRDPAIDKPLEYKVICRAAALTKEELSFCSTPAGSSMNPVIQRSGQEITLAPV